MATTALLIEATPLKLKQGTLLHTFRPLPSKPTAMFSYKHCFAPGLRFKNPKPPQCYSLRAEKTIHYVTADTKSDHPSLSQCLNVSKDNRPAATNPNFTTKLKEKSLKALRKPATAAVLLGLLVTYNPNSAVLAAPVGRVGGSLTSNTTTSYYPSEYSSTKTKIRTDDCFCESIFDPGVIVFCLASLTVGFCINFLPFSNLANFTLTFLWCYVMIDCLLFLVTTSVVKIQLQVNLSNTGRAVQMDLNRIAETADTYTHKGLRYVLRDTAVALLRQRDHCISGYSSEVIQHYGRPAARQFFDKLVVRERVRHDEETIVDNADDTQYTASQRSTNESHSDNVVVTILLVAEGEYSKSLTIIDNSDVKRVLEELASINPRKRVLGVEILWTPQLSLNAVSKCTD